MITVFPRHAGTKTFGHWKISHVCQYFYVIFCLAKIMPLWLRVISLGLFINLYILCGSGASKKNDAVPWDSGSGSVKLVITEGSARTECRQAFGRAKHVMSSRKVHFFRCLRLNCCILKQISRKLKTGSRIICVI
jgi:hypothetical protein